MKNKIIIAVLSCAIIVAMFGCQKKDLPLDSNLVKERQAVLEKDLKNLLQDAEYGFLLYPEDPATSTLVNKSANFTLKFDTVKNQVTMSSSITRYTGPLTSYYTLSAGTGMPLLSFSTNSLISQIYTTGDKGITDYFFRVMKLAGDTIKIQAYRQNATYKAEGGPVFNMLKIRPSIDIPSKSSFDTVSVAMNRYADNSVSLRNPVKFGAALNIASYTSDVVVNLAADASLVDSYNQKNKTQYKVFPSGTYDLVVSKVGIASGSKNSVDNFEVNIKNYASFENGTDYILPVKATASAPFVVGPKSVAYIVLRISNVNPNNALIAGNLVNRSKWTVTASGSYVSNPVALVLDASNSTSWSSEGGLPAWLRLDMGENKTVKGFRLVPSYAYRNENWLTANVYSSADGITWKYIGIYNGTTTATSSSAANPDIKNLSFITPVTGRYFRFDIIKSTDGSYTGLAELNAIE